MPLLFTDRVDLETLLSNAKLEHQETVTISTAQLEALLDSAPTPDTQTQPLSL